MTRRIFVDDLTGAATAISSPSISPACMPPRRPARCSRSTSPASLDVTVWSLWENDAILGIGALKALSDGTGDVKSMRAHPAQLRKSAARMLLEHIVTQAKARGMARLSLETGNGPAFVAALALYRARGFHEGEPFADHVGGSGFNRFFHLDLGED